MDPAAPPGAARRESTPSAVESGTDPAGRTGPADTDTLDSIRSIEGELRTLVRRLRTGKRETARLIDPELMPSTYTVLIFVAERQPTRASEIVELLEMDKSVISRHLSVLGAMGLIRRDADPADRRAQTISLSEDGRRKVSAAIAHRRESFSRHLGTWSTEQLDSFARQLAHFNSALGQ